MTGRRYHHGDLRTALLIQAEKTLRSSGVDGLSLRELARDVGVSHAAPRRHFADKVALLDALAADGFRQLGVALTDAAAPGGSARLNGGEAKLGPAHEPDDRGFVATLENVALAYVRFATVNPALVDLMSTSRYLADASAELRQAREDAFSAVTELVSVGQATGELIDGDHIRIGTTLFATLHGIAVLANNKMINPLDATVVRDAVRSLLDGLAPRG
ncbi:TetR/AcrR family transcriptional regulator [Mycobacterium sp. CSUR Q5927]|nr:TetR/AcrR family transcriptional regulator [Mycobacterium sp. CSUR Q5927]